jgi:hypothetical protein
MKEDGGHPDVRVLLSSKKSGSNAQRIKQGNQKDHLLSPKKKSVDHNPFSTGLVEFEERVSQISDQGRMIVHDSKEKLDHKKKAGGHGRSSQAESGKMDMSRIKLSGTACFADDLKLKLRNLLSLLFKQLSN